MIDRHVFSLLRNRSTWFDFIVIVVVIVLAVTAPLLYASGVGLGLAIFLFLREQIRTQVIRRKSYGDSTFSRRKYLPDDLAALQRHGRETVICELQGSLFFGTTDQLLTRLEGDLKTCRRVILDMRRVTAVDYTATHILEQVAGMLADRGGELIIADVQRALPTGRDLQAYFDEVGLCQQSRLHVFASRGEALEYVEDRVLAEEDRLGKGHGAPLALEEIELLKRLDPETMAALRGVVEEREVAEGEHLFRAGAPGEGIYFVRKGTIKIMLPLADGRTVHLASFARGDFFGDMAFLDRETRSADAVAATRAWLFHLSRARFDALAPVRPELGYKVFHRLARALALRLRQADAQLRELEEG